MSTKLRSILHTCRRLFSPRRHMGSSSAMRIRLPEFFHSCSFAMTSGKPYMVVSFSSSNSLDVSSSSCCSKAFKPSVSSSNLGSYSRYLPAFMTAPSQARSSGMYNLNVKVNVVPSPNVDSNSMLPSKFFTRRRLIVRPRPIPFVLIFSFSSCTQPNNLNS